MQLLKLHYTIHGCRLWARFSSTQARTFHLILDPSPLRAVCSICKHQSCSITPSVFTPLLPALPFTLPNCLSWFIFLRVYSLYLVALSFESQNPGSSNPLLLLSGGHSIWGALGHWERYLAQVSFFLATERVKLPHPCQDPQRHGAADPQRSTSWPRCGRTTDTGQGWDRHWRFP